MTTTTMTTRARALLATSESTVAPNGGHSGGEHDGDTDD
jgi:hypothetical protein